MWLDRVSNPGPLALEPGTLPTALRGPDFSLFWRSFSVYYLLYREC